jgi:dihydropteroate synthase
VVIKSVATKSTERLAGLLQQPSTLVMAVLNRTPDSFSDGGQLQELSALLAAAETALVAGAEILDIGGESTRPGAGEICIEEEMARVLPAIKALAQRFPRALLSIDTRKAAVAQAAVEAGACMINDVSGLQYDSGMVEVAARTGAFLVLMHAQGTPETMQENPTYCDVVEEVSQFLGQQAQRALAAGVREGRILVDPGFGFGKTLEHNLTLLAQLERFQSLGYPILVGTSRKSFLAMNNAALGPQEREALTATSLGLALAGGARVVRIHDAQTQVPVVRFLDATRARQKK